MLGRIFFQVQVLSPSFYSFRYFFSSDCYWTRNVIRYNKNVYKLNVFIYRKGCVLLLSKKLEPIFKKVKTRGRYC